MSEKIIGFSIMISNNKGKYDWAGQYGVIRIPKGIFLLMKCKINLDINLNGGKA